MPSRPLSPHLSVYKFKYTLVSSILNRFSGIALSVGLIALTYWLLAVASGARAQAQAQALLSTPLARLFLAAMVIAFCYHLVAGVRHLVWDTGRGLERTTAQKSAWLVGLLSIVLMLLIFYWLWRGGHAP
ncbi:MAG TPA: succinate dehydrogenase, cytochrome b556 subunit [Steroidobacteraceae bacterium]|jgi:succinate dehydrogenase / fumarate reductase cytochrome b subunit